MSDEAGKDGQPNLEETKTAELSDQDLQKVAGGAGGEMHSTTPGVVNPCKIMAESTDKDHFDPRIAVTILK